MQVPICGFDAKNAVLCPQCEAKMNDGRITKADVDASIKLANLAKKNTQIEKFSLTKCIEIDENYVLYLSKDDVLTIRQSRILYRIIQNEFPGKIWIVESTENEKKFIEDLFFPTRILSINSVWAPGGIQKTKAIVSGRWTPKFPLDINKIIQIVKNAKNLEIEIEFEQQRK